MPVTSRIDSSGLSSKPGGGGLAIEGNVRNRGFLPYKVFSSNTLVGATTTAYTMDESYCGLNVLTSSGATAITVTLMSASSVPGCSVIFRSTSANAHVITASQDPIGSQAICFMTGTAIYGLGGQNLGRGSNLTFPAVPNACVSLMSDGKNWQVHFLSGAFTLQFT